MYDACVPWPERPKGAKDKSRGPKGLELEVGARRAPKLLLAIILFGIFLWVHWKHYTRCKSCDMNFQTKGFVETSVAFRTPQLLV